MHFSVTDVNNDVRRTAAICLGFILFKQYEDMPKFLKLLGLSYNPHVRYGTALALGIGCAGTGYKEAIELI